MLYKIDGFIMKKPKKLMYKPIKPGLRLYLKIPVEIKSVSIFALIALIFEMYLWLKILPNITNNIPAIAMRFDVIETLLKLNS